MVNLPAQARAGAARVRGAVAGPKGRGCWRCGPLTSTGRRKDEQGAEGGCMVPEVDVDGVSGWAQHKAFQCPHVRGKKADRGDGVAAGGGGGVEVVVLQEEIERVKQARADRERERMKRSVLERRNKRKKGRRRKGWSSSVLETTSFFGLAVAVADEVVDAAIEHALSSQLRRMRMNLIIAMSTWRFFVRERKNDERIADVVIRIHHRSERGKAFKAWRVETSRLQSVRVTAVKALFFHHRHVLLRHTVDAWTEYVARVRADALFRECELRLKHMNRTKSEGTADEVRARACARAQAAGAKPPPRRGASTA